VHEPDLRTPGVGHFEIQQGVWHEHGHGGTLLCCRCVQRVQARTSVTMSLVGYGRIGSWVGGQLAADVVAGAAPGIGCAGVAVTVGCCCDCWKTLRSEFWKSDSNSSRVIGNAAAPSVVGGSRVCC